MRVSGACVRGACVRVRGACVCGCALGGASRGLEFVLAMASLAIFGGDGAAGKTSPTVRECTTRWDGGRNSWRSRGHSHRKAGNLKRARRGVHENHGGVGPEHGGNVNVRACRVGTMVENTPEHGGM